MCVCRMAQLLRLDMRLCGPWKCDFEAIGVRLAYIDRLPYGGNVQSNVQGNF